MILLDSSPLSFRGKYFKPYAQPIRRTGSLIKSRVTKEILLPKVSSQHIFAVSGVIMGMRVWEVIEQISDERGPMGHGCNYSGHPLRENAGPANLEILEVESLTENAATPARISSSNFTRRLIIIRSWEKCVGWV